MKLISISLGSWLIGLAVILLTFSVVEGVNLSAADIKGATVTSLIIAALLFSLAYAPSLFWLRKRLGGCRPASVFPLASAIVLNIRTPALLNFFPKGIDLVSQDPTALLPD